MDCDIVSSQLKSLNVTITNLRTQIEGIETELSSLTKRIQEKEERLDYEELVASQLNEREVNTSR